MSERNFPSREELAERADANEPIVSTPALDVWAELDLPLRGEIRQNVVERLRHQARSRRTVEGVASRIAANITSPVTNAIQDEAEDRVRGRVQSQLEKQLQRRSEQ